MNSSWRIAGAEPGDRAGKEMAARWACIVCRR